MHKKKKKLKKIKDELKGKKTSPSTGTADNAGGGNGNPVRTDDHKAGGTTIVKE